VSPVRHKDVGYLLEVALKLTYYKKDVPNFGDELNEYIWPRLIDKSFFDEDASTLFVGIGSIIYDNYPADARKIVVGSGYAGYSPPPNAHDGTWDFRFVRGPLTAETLGISPASVITDSAILIRAVETPAPDTAKAISFIPHFDSLERGLWREVCEIAGIHLIDPTAAPETVLAEIKASRLVITEAMHGAIVSDALRTPWIAVEPIHKSHRFKWFDWAKSLSITLRPHRLPPSNSLEAWMLATGATGDGLASRVTKSAAAKPFDAWFREAAAKKLRRLAESEPQMSLDADVERATDQAISSVKSLAGSRFLA
jgi:succinoglycan biosynthesis protein ExoV